MRRLRYLFPALPIALVALLPCAPAGADFFTPETIQRFAPLLVVEKEEDNGPASIPWFLNRSTLMFAESDPCSNETLHSGPWSEEAIARLGLMVAPEDRWTYRNKRSPLCHHSGATLIATDHTRPFDSHRAAGLNIEEGFFLHFGGSQTGMPFAVDQADDEFKTAAPAYYDDGELLGADGKPQQPRRAYLTYWFFYAYNDAPPVPFLWNHQGDWENISLLFEQTEDGGNWALRESAYAAHGNPKARSASCQGTTEPLDCPTPRETWQGTTRLVGYVANGDHATYPTPGEHPLRLTVADRTSAFGSGLAWPTWKHLEPLESQPWAGFCGAWGDVGGSIPGTGLGWAEDRTGPLGPGCLDDNQRQRKTGRPPSWGASRSSAADRKAKPGRAVGIGL